MLFNANEPQSSLLKQCRDTVSKLMCQTAKEFRFSAIINNNAKEMHFIIGVNSHPLYRLLKFFPIFCVRCALDVAHPSIFRSILSFIDGGGGGGHQRHQQPSKRTSLSESNISSFRRRLEKCFLFKHSAGYSRPTNESYWELYYYYKCPSSSSIPFLSFLL